MMHPSKFRQYKRLEVSYSVPPISMENVDYDFVPGQGCSVYELFERLQSGKPIPNLDAGYSFNGRTIDELTVCDTLGVDRSVVFNEHQRLKKETNSKIIEENEKFNQKSES